MSVRTHYKVFLFRLMIICFLFHSCNAEENEPSYTPESNTRELQSKEDKGRPEAPDFTLQDLSGNGVSLKQFKGQVVFVDFWATWCAPCRQSIPELVAIQEKYRDQGLVVLGISVDDRKTSVKALSAFKKQYKINYSILRADRNVAMAYFGNGQMPIPTLFVIDREGRVMESIVGYAPGAVERALKKLI
ncbi:MAG: TlpA family protein disulfide reductase [Deltaproteobacteria bacterium]|nr:TlpA family protein disulfide reductase [Deltaproteobacteria bacterium]